MDKIIWVLMGVMAVVSVYLGFFDSARVFVG